MDDLPEQVIANGKSGWYVRVLREGVIEAGQEIKFIERPNPGWSIARANQLMFHRPDDVEGFREFAEIELLSESWRRHFAKRVAATEK
jgi:MOSC domain-containing protein YiiM